MNKPMRIQRKREKGWRMPENTVCVSRPSKWGNPFVPGRRSPFGTVIADKRHAYSIYIGFAPQNDRLCAAARAELRGKNLACYCKLCDVHAAGKPFDVDCPYCERCHADPLGRIANSEEASR